MIQQPGLSFFFKFFFFRRWKLSAPLKKWASVDQMQRRDGGQCTVGVGWGCGLERRGNHARVCVWACANVCVCKEETAAVIAREEPCARRTLKLIKGGDRVIIHYGPLERLTLKSLLLINSETVLRINNNIKKGTERKSANTSWIWFKLFNYN